MRPRHGEYSLAEWLIVLVILSLTVAWGSWLLLSLAEVVLRLSRS